MAVLSILDWSLSEHQKTKVKSFFETVWIFLSYREAKEIERLILTFGGQYVVISASCVGATSLLMLFMLSDRISHMGLFAKLDADVFANGCVAGIIVAIVHMCWLDNSADFPQYKRRSDRVTALALLILTCLFVSGVALVIPDYLTAGFTGAFYALLLFSGFASTISSAALCWLLITFCLRGVLRTIQFIVERVVEYPKGPILGLSGLLMAIGALVKILGP